MHRTSAVLAFIVFVLAPLGSQEMWEGTATPVRPGEFDSPGLFAASNSFPPNSRIELENLRNGRKVQVVVVKRIEDVSGLFMLLSPEAAGALDVTRSEVVRVRARLVPPRAAANTAPSVPSYSQDPDNNPLVGIPEPAAPPATAQSFEEPPSAFETSATSPTDPQPEEDPQDEPWLIAADPDAAGEAESIEDVEVIEFGEAADSAAGAEPDEAVVVTEVTEVVETTEMTEVVETTEMTEVAEAETEAEIETEAEAGEAPGSAEVAGSPLLPEEEALPGADEVLERRAERSPQKRLFMPPREDERFVLRSSPVPEEAAEAGEIGSGEAAAEIAAVEADSPEEPEEGEVISRVRPSADEELNAPAELPEVVEETATASETAVVAETGAAATGVDDGAASAAASAAGAGPAEQPAGPAAAEPVGAPEPTARVAGVPTATVPAIQTVDRLSPRSYFLQLGAYTSLDLARRAAGNLGDTYSVAVLAAPSGSRTVYRLMVGPLNRDESGVILYTLRARGFRDAFLRYVE